MTRHLNPIPTPKLQHEFRHAHDFGITGNWNKSNGVLFEEAIRKHVQESPIQITGTYRGRIPVTHYLDPSTKLWVAVDQFDDFFAGWQLSLAQVRYLRSKGNVQ
ncbi:MAG: colicin D domain-containing protein [Chloroflexota bacterium]